MVFPIHVLAPLGIQAIFATRPYYTASIAAAGAVKPDRTERAHLMMPICLSLVDSLKCIDPQTE